jgi:hypothetical protein
MQRIATPVFTGKSNHAMKRLIEALRISRSPGLHARMLGLGKSFHG